MRFWRLLAHVDWPVCGKPVYSPQLGLGCLSGTQRRVFIASRMVERIPIPKPKECDAYLGRSTRTPKLVSFLSALHRSSPFSVWHRVMA